MEQHQENQLEKFKSLSDYCKHICTLSTGSLLVVTTLATKIFDKPNWKFLVAISLISYMFSVIGAVLSHTMEIIKMNQSLEDDSGEETKNGFDERIENWNTLGAGLMWGGFLIGTICVTIFAVKNLNL